MRKDKDGKLFHDRIRVKTMNDFKITKGDIWYSVLMEYEIIIQEVTSEYIIYRVNEQERALLVDTYEEFLTRFKQK